MGKEWEYELDPWGQWLHDGQISAVAAIVAAAGLFYLLQGRRRI